MLRDSFGNELLNENISDGSSGDEVLVNGVWNGETLINWDSVGNTISRIANETGGSTIGIKGEYSLDGNVESLNLEGLEHKLSHFFSVDFWVSWGFGQKDFVLTWVASELVGEAVFPDLFHIVPVGNDTRLDWVVKLKDTSHFLGLITNILRLGFNTDHLLVSSWSSYNRWELNLWLILSAETSFDDSGSIIDNNIFRHFFPISFTFCVV